LTTCQGASRRNLLISRLPAALAALATTLSLGLAAPASAAGALHGDNTGPLTRAQAREALKTARAAGTTTLAGEIGDSEAVLAAREHFNALQAEVLPAEYERGQARVAELEQRSRAQAEQQALAAEMDDAYSYEAGASTFGAPIAIDYD
jgi:hypothetical protein